MSSPFQTTSTVYLVQPAGFPLNNLQFVLSPITKKQPTHEAMMTRLISIPPLKSRVQLDPSTHSIPKAKWGSGGAS